MKFIFGFEHEKINFISPSNHVLFYLLYKPTNYDVFDDFPKISENFQNVVQRLYECFRTFSENFRSFRTIAEDCQGRSEDVYHTCVDIIFIHTCVILFFSICYHSLKHCSFYNNVAYHSDLILYAIRTVDCGSDWLLAN